jgi:pimeloyl-ACP methyl ester carboxylesterase
LVEGSVVEVDPDALAWPHPFSQAPAGTYRIAARLVRSNRDDVTGPVVVQAIDPAHAGPIDLRLASSRAAAPPAEDTDTVKIVRYESHLLSAFYGRPITMGALVILPDGYGTDPRRKYVTEYQVPGFGLTFPDAIRRFLHAREPKRTDPDFVPMVRVVLPGTMASGHHVFADSPNNGPWGRALVEELIPELEHRFALIASPRARLLSGHSSGGWSSLWLQITHPDFFGGTWSTAPDPVDLRSFTTVDVTPGSKENFFRNKDGSPRMLMRDHGQDVAALEDFVRFEDVMGDVSVFGTFDWVFSPRGPRGEPMHLFDRATGEQDPVVQRAWEKWDIHKVLDANWATLSPKLKGKLHVFAGGADTFHLNESLSLLCDFLKSKEADATCELVPGKTHFDLTGDPADPKSLRWRIRHEMASAARVGQ